LVLNLQSDVSDVIPSRVPNVLSFHSVRLSTDQLYSTQKYICICTDTLALKVKNIGITLNTLLTGIPVDIQTFTVRATLQ